MNFHRLIKPILQAKCAECHRGSRDAPDMSYQSLEDYVWYLHGDAGTGLWGHKFAGSRTIPGYTGAHMSWLYAGRPDRERYGCQNLSSLDPVTASSGSGTIQNDASAKGTPLTLNDQIYQSGLGVQAPSEIVCSLEGAYTQFVSDIGVDQMGNRYGSVTFEVWVDGSRVYKSERLFRNAMDTVDVDLRGARELKLVVTDAGNGMRDDFANWAGARLHYAIEPNADGSPQGFLDVSHYGVSLTPRKATHHHVAGPEFQ